MGLKDDYLENHLMNANLCAFQTMEQLEAKLTDAMPFNVLQWGNVTFIIALSLFHNHLDIMEMIGLDST